MGPHLFFPIENKEEVDYLPVKVGFFNCRLRVVKGKIKSVVILGYLFPKSE